jgi:hypothetical protein
MVDSLQITYVLLIVGLVCLTYGVILGVVIVRYGIRIGNRMTLSAQNNAPLDEPVQRTILQEHAGDTNYESADG